MNTLSNLSNQILLESYKKAKKSNLDESFIEIIVNEMKRRGLWGEKC